MTCDPFLIFCAEIFRYFPVEEASTNYVKQLPFAIALSMGLEMLCSGEIELEDLFDHDADLGLPTGVKILDNAQSVGIKFKNLLTQYQQYLEDLYPIVGSFKRAFPHGKVVCTEEQHTLRLQNSFGKH